MILLLALLIPPAALAHPFDSLTAELARNPELVDVSRWPGIQLDIRYASPRNFTGENIYGPFSSCFLHREAASGLQDALRKLDRKRPGWKLRVFDCLRPVRAQKKLFEKVAGTSQEKYVVPPELGSLHNYGFAIDAGLSDASGREVDMGTSYDFFGPLAEPRREEDFLELGELTREQLRNRELLRKILREAGFAPISTEWWHFDALDGYTVRSRYRKIP